MSFVRSPFFIDIESKFEKKTKGSEPPVSPGEWPWISMRTNFFHRPEFDLYQCISIYSHAFSLLFGVFCCIPFSGHSHKITNFFQQTQPTLPSFRIITLELWFFQVNNILPTKWGLLRSLFCMTKKNMFPTKVLLVFIRFKNSTKREPTYKSMCPRRVWEYNSLIENPLEKALKHSLLVVEI